MNEFQFHIVDFNKKIYYFLLFFIIFNSNVNCQQIVEIDSVLIKKAFKLHKKVLTNYKNKNYNKALDFSLKELNIYTKQSIKDEKYNKAIFNIALLYFKMKQFSNARIFFKKYVKLSQISKKAIAYKYLGKIYKYYGDYEKAIVYYKEGIYYAENTFNYRTQYDLYLDLFDVYNIFKKPYGEDRMRLLQKTNSLKTKFNFSNRNKYKLNNNFAFYYLNDATYNLEKAKKYYLKNLSISLKNKDSLISAATFNNLGELYIHSVNDSAIYYLRQALKFNKDYIPYYHSNLATFYYKKRVYNKALIEINIALSFEFNKNESKLNIIQNKFDFLKQEDKIFMLYNLSLKIKIFIELYKETKNIDYIKNAIILIKKYDELIDFIKSNNLESTSESFWQEEVSPIYFKAVYCCEILNNYSLAFYFSEKNKAALLLKNSKLSYLKSKLPENILLTEKIYKAKINVLNSLLVTTNSNYDSIKREINRLYFNYNQFKDSIKLNYPKLYENKEFSTLSLKEIQSRLYKDEVVISFISDVTNINANNIFEIIITKEHINFVKIKDLKDFNNNIKVLHSLLIKPLVSKKELQRYRETANYIYKKIFPTTQFQNLIKTKKLKIIVDPSIQNIPFEALSVTDKTNDYLINYTNVSYAYSISFLFRNNIIKRNPNKNFIGFAPFSNSSLDKKNISYSKFELNSINSFANSEIYFDTTATKKSFINNSNNHNIIHLSTHADAGINTSPFIEFRDEKLSLSELYSIRTEADLVVLSACNTSVGENLIGEGVQSLARGFFYSGSKTVVSSLWNVNDRSSANLMIDFYRNLYKGKTKSEALRLAKLSYLKKHSLSEASPYYWSSFILIGDGGKLHQINTDYNYYYIFILFVLIFFGLIIKTMGNKYI